MKNPKNYRHANPPYGYKILDGELTLCKKELKVCRLIVKLIEKEGLSLRGVGRALGGKKIKNRRGRISWGHQVVKTIFENWKGKV